MKPLRADDQAPDDLWSGAAVAIMIIGAATLAWFGYMAAGGARRWSRRRLHPPVSTTPEHGADPRSPAPTIRTRRRSTGI